MIRQNKLFLKNIFYNEKNKEKGAEKNNLVEFERKYPSFAKGTLKTNIKKLPLLRSAGGRNRTADTRIFSPLLYRLSYPGFPKKRFSAKERGKLTQSQNTVNWYPRVAFSEKSLFSLV